MTSQVKSFKKSKMMKKSGDPSFLQCCVRRQMNRAKTMSSASSLSLLAVYAEVISANEEQQLLKFLSPLLARRQYEGAHWDSVISKYKEIELSPKSYRIPPNIQEILERMRNLIKEKLKASKKEDVSFLNPHIIDLAEDGHIGNF
jgi:hypothetical protein